MIHLPAWAYDKLKEEGRDMSGFIRAEYRGPEPKERIVRYLNREARRAAKRKR